MHEPLADLLARAAAALQVVKGRALAVQDALDGGAPSSRPSAALQALDLLTQEAAALAGVLRAAAEACPREWRLASGPLTAGVPLAELAGRLACDAAPPSAAGVAGDVQFF